MVFEKMVQDFGLWVIVTLIVLALVFVLIFALNIFGLRDLLASHLRLFRI